MRPQNKNQCICEWQESVIIIVCLWKLRKKRDVLILVSTVHDRGMNSFINIHVPWLKHIVWIIESHVRLNRVSKLSINPNFQTTCISSTMNYKKTTKGKQNTRKQISLKTFAKMEDIKVQVWVHEGSNLIEYDCVKKIGQNAIFEMDHKVTPSWHIWSRNKTNQKERGKWICQYLLFCTDANS